jgi:gluconokinase
VQGEAGRGHNAPLAIIVMGVSGSGKSTLGALLAHELGCTFLEGDSFHSDENVAKMRAAIPLTDEDRWPWLDRLGNAMGDAAHADGLAVTACSALKRIYRERLSVAARVPVAFVMLGTTSQELARRLDNRPGHYMPPSLLDSQLQTLEPPGLDEHALILDSDEAPAALSRRVCDWLAHHMTKAG